MATASCFSAWPLGGRSTSPTRFLAAARSASVSSARAATSMAAGAARASAPAAKRTVESAARRHRRSLRARQPERAGHRPVHAAALPLRQACQPLVRVAVMPRPAAVGRRRLGARGACGAAVVRRRGRMRGELSDERRLHPRRLRCRRRRSAIEDWILTTNIDPMTGETLKIKAVFPDDDMKLCCEQYLKSLQPTGLGRGGHGGTGRGRGERKGTGRKGREGHGSRPSRVK